MSMELWYQLRYVHRNIDSGIVMDYITGTSNLYQIWGRHKKQGQGGEVALETKAATVAQLVVLNEYRGHLQNFKLA
jgi:hypothetical protein